MSPPDRIPCKCGDVKGDLVLKQAVIEFTDDAGKKRRVQPSEFESISGKAAAKKWKSSIKVRGIPGFDGREIGLYMREELGVDINRGVFTVAVAAKPGTQAKPIATSKAAVTKLAATLKGGSHIAKSPRAPTVASVKRPLEERLQAQLKSTFVCYEVPTPSKFTADRGKPSMTVQLSGSWQQAAFADDGSPRHVLSGDVAEIHHSDEGCNQDEVAMDTRMLGDHAVELVNGKPTTSSASILDLAQTSFSVLFSLGIKSGSGKAFSGSTLSSLPAVPEQKMSRFLEYGHAKAQVNVNEYK
eukprot:jgi/Ulvmu1/7602/UM038_0027.1